MDALNVSSGHKPGWTRTQCVQEKTERAVLDLVLYKGKNTIHDLRIDDKKVLWSGSDHHLITWTRDEIPEKTAKDKKKKPKWNVTHEKNNWDGFRNFLDEIVQSKSETFANGEMERKFELNLRWIKESASQNIKQSNPKNNARKDYKRILSEAVRKLTEERAEIRRDCRKAEKDKDKEEMSKYSQLILEKTREIKRQEDLEAQEKTLKLCDDMANKDHKNMDLYKHVSSFKAQKSQAFGLKKEDGSYAETEPEVDELLSDMWENQIYKKRKWDSTPENRKVEPKLDEEDRKVVSEFMDKPITIQEVDMAIKHLKTGTSHGTTQVAPEMLKNTGPLFRENLRKWMNMCFEEGLLPTINEIMRITMLHKKGATSTLKNYRSLAVGCNICKLLLKIIGWRLEIVAEFLQILGEMQAGFRAGRRTQDNLIILDTLLRYTREGHSEDHKLMIAMMDISKAYDRVDRDILWEKMEQYGFSEKILKFLRGTYKDARGIINFQGFQSSEKRLEIGLKQGCVLSPILFAIYICDLETKLLQAGIGPMIGGQQMPGMMFADDMIIIAPEHKFQELLDIMGDFAHKNKIEFSAAKSVVIPLHRPANPQKHWKVGYLYNDEGESEDIIMSEVEQGKYLGVELKRTKPHYKKHSEDAISKAKRFLWPVGRMTKGLGRKVQVTHKIWEIYCVRRIIYGLDVAEINKTTLDSLDIIQNRVARLATDSTPWTKKILLQGEMNFQPWVFRVLKEKLCLLTYLNSLGESRWAKKALNQQTEWLNKDRAKASWAAKKTPSYWLQEVVIMANAQGIPEAVYLNEDTYSKAASTMEVRKAMLKDYNTRMTAEIDKRDYLKYQRDKVYPGIDKSINKWDGSYFWWQMKTGVLAEKYDERFDFKAGIIQIIRDLAIKNRLCLLCDGRDSIEHALWLCRPIKEQNKQDNIEIPNIEKERLKQVLTFVKDLDKMSEHEAFFANLWLLNNDQPDQSKREIGNWFKRVLQTRKELIGIKKGNLPKP